MIQKQKLAGFFKQEIPVLPYWLDEEEDLSYQLFCLFYLFEGDYPSNLIKEEVWKEWCCLYENKLLDNLEL